MTQTLKHFLQKIEKHFVAQKAIKELNSLSDRELNDMGISRGDIYSVVHGDKDMRRCTNVNNNLKGFV